MLDIKLVRTDPNKIRKNLEKRAGNFPIDELIAVDKSWRTKLQELEKLRAIQNKVSLEIAKNKDATKIKEMKKISDDIKKLEEEIKNLKEKENKLFHSIPNLLHESVPEGTTEADNVEIRKWGEIPMFDFQPKDHIDIGMGLGMIDVERAAKISGARFYFLRGDLVRLDYSIMLVALEHLSSRGYTMIEPPYLINRKAYDGVVNLDAFEEMIYKIEDEDLYMIATSEHPMVAMHINECFKKTDLPIKYAGISTCFRKEAGSHGKDTKGIFRVHQFNKVEQLVFSTQEDSWNLHEEMIKNAEDLMQKLDLPGRVVVLCGKETGSVSAKTYDFELWFPAQGKYREAGSCSNCTDYQARRLNIKYSDGDERKFCHVLNSTAVATSRVLSAILENFQQKDGTVKIPKILQQYMGGKKILEPLE